MAKNIVKIPKFFSELKSVWLFLSVMLVSTLLFIIFYQPAFFLRSPHPVSNLNLSIFTLIMVSSASALFVASRLLLFAIQRRHTIDFALFIIWLVSELIVIAVLLTVIAFFLGNRERLPFSDMLWRVLLDFLTIVAVPYIVAVLVCCLHERIREVQALRGLLESSSAQLPSEGENLIFYDRGGKLAFSTRRTNVLYIEAADNYCNIHYLNEGKESTFILHNSMKHIDASDEYQGLLRCHRSFMVNIENVKLLRKDKEGLVLELSEGTRAIPVSRTYTERVVNVFAGTPSSL